MQKLVNAIVLIVFLLIEGLLLDMASAAEHKRPFRIGALTASWGPTPQIIGLRDGLVALGYREEEDFFLGIRFTQGDLTALPSAARQLVQLGVDLIFTSEDGPTRAAQQATSQIPIVFSVVSDPVGMGLIQSFARPGGNITGVTDLFLELVPKRLEIFHQLLPGLKWVLYPYNVGQVHAVAHANAYQKAARQLGVELVEQPVLTMDEARAALTNLEAGDVDGIIHPWTLGLNIQGLILEATKQQRIPSISGSAFWAEQGALASYGPSSYQTGRQAARLVDKIIKGANPANIPVEVNSKIEFAINLKTAKTLGLTISPEMLYRADKIIR
jgi:putative ABC transport system substrate-binding protein